MSFPLAPGILTTISSGILPIHSGNGCKLGFSGNERYCNLGKLQSDSGIDATHPTKFNAVKSLNLEMSSGIFKAKLVSFLVFLNVNLSRSAGNVSKNSSKPYNAMNLDAASLG